MRPETEARIRNVQKFGRYARSICALLATLLALVTLTAWGVLLAGPRAAAGFKIGLGAFNVTGEQLTTVSIRVWSFIVVTVVMGIVAWALVHLYRLFTHLAAGSIYTQQNVYHLRQIGLLSMAMAVLQLFLPPLSFALAELGLIDRAFVLPMTDNGRGTLVFGTGSFGGFVTASLILLASWIMDVGREISEDAEAMRREADLVI